MTEALAQIDAIIARESGLSSSRQWLLDALSDVRRTLEATPPASDERTVYLFNTSDFHLGMTDEEITAGVEFYMRVAGLVKQAAENNDAG